jgi:hypothetical protein
MASARKRAILAKLITHTALNHHRYIRYRYTRELIHAEAQKDMGAMQSILSKWKQEADLAEKYLSKEPGANNFIAREKGAIAKLLKKYPEIKLITHKGIIHVTPISITINRGTSVTPPNTKIHHPSEEPSSKSWWNTGSAFLKKLNSCSHKSAKSPENNPTQSRQNR